MTELRGFWNFGPTLTKN